MLRNLKFDAVMQLAGTENLAVALFIGMAGGPVTAPSGGGGGLSADNNWGRDKDEDDLRWARRCAQRAIMITPRLKRCLHR